MTDLPVDKTVVIAGAGPAGLTAALELLRRTEYVPLLFELEAQVGGISKTVVHRGNRMDLGGHRFFSKSDWVMDWWQGILPIAAEDPASDATLRITYQGRSRQVRPAMPPQPASDAVMLVRRRLSRIYYRRRFFDYPLRLNVQTLGNLGLLETLRIGASYGTAQLRPRSQERTLEDFLVNRFGRRLYRTFFKDYTEKVWGVPCEQISAEWGAQRIKGLSIRRALAHAVRHAVRPAGDPRQKGVETSLIERFLYPKFGPGQMWEAVAAQIGQRGGRVELRHRVVGIEREGATLTGIRVRDERTGQLRLVPCAHFISTMPVSHLVEALKPGDDEVAAIARALPYRDFLTVGLLVTRMRCGTRASSAAHGMPPDNWIYIQEPDVKIGRLQIFNNWSPALVADPNTIWLGLEYFCGEGDEIWSRPDAAMIDFAAAELVKIGLLDPGAVLDGTVVRVPKAYPAYFGEYARVDRVREFLDGFANLYPVGRNGMHRYNNQDHSMLAARAAVDSIASGALKTAIWKVNAEEAYHEDPDAG